MGSEKPAAVPSRAVSLRPHLPVKPVLRVLSQDFVLFVNY